MSGTRIIEARLLTLNLGINPSVTSASLEVAARLMIAIFRGSRVVTSATPIQGSSTSAFALRGIQFRSVQSSLTLRKTESFI
jgi:hypothetical protein